VLKQNLQETNENKNTKCMACSQAMLRGKFIALNAILESKNI
jgi:hypothetical protein